MSIPVIHPPAPVFKVDHSPWACRGFEQINDQVQDCFVRLWNNCAKVTEEKSLSYLFTTATRIQIDEFRKGKIRLRYKEDSKPLKCNKEDAQFILEEDEFRQRLEEVINSMRPKSREVFMMNRYDKLTYREIADVLEISVKAVEKRMSTALKHMIENKINIKR